MKPFVFHNPVEVYFGEGQIKHLPELITRYGDKVLLVYGKSAIKRMGLYDTVLELLDAHGITVVELGGIDPNPRIESIREGGRLCKEHGIDLVLAVGGGSVIDAAKGIASAALYDGDPWDFYSYQAESKGALPIGTILTLAATGSEMNRGSVVTNFATKEKNGWGSAYTYPKFSILDPTYTYSVNKHQTGCGIVDSLTHIFEFYFSRDHAPLNDRIVEGIMKTILHDGPIAIADPENYEARANLMFASTLALNGLSGFGKTWDGFNHTTEHVLSAFYDIAHADGLAILAPHWMDYILSDDNVTVFERFVINVFGLPKQKDPMATARQGIAALRAFYERIGMPTKLHHVGIDDSEFDAIAAQATRNGGTVGRFVSLDQHDVRMILESAK